MLSETVKLAVFSRKRVVMTVSFVSVVVLGSPVMRSINIAGKLRASST